MLCTASLKACARIGLPSLAIHRGAVSTDAMVNCARAGNIRPTHVSGQHIVFRPGSAHSRHPRSGYKLGPEEHRAHQATSISIRITLPAQ